MPGAYYEQELSSPAKDIHRAIVSLEEELEAVNSYNQRMDVTGDEDLKALLEHNRNEEIEHASMLVEWLRRRIPEFDKELRRYLFRDGSITAAEAGEAAPAEEKATDDGNGSLGIGKL